MKITDPFLDINGLVLPNPKSEEKPSDNGILFTSVSVLLDFEVPDYEQKVRECYLDTGLLARWKGNNWDQMAWDCYLGTAAACIKLGITSIPREILSYGIKHWFVYDTNNTLELKDCLLRNVPIWPIMLLAAFPSLKWLFYPFVYIVQKFFEDPIKLIETNNTNGFQLQWVYLKACSLAGIEFPSFKAHEENLPKALSIYYHITHPFNKLFNS